MVVEQVEDGPRDRLVAPERRGELAEGGGQMAEGGGGHQIEAVGNGRTNHVAEVAIVDREGLREGVIVLEVILVVEAHRVVVGWALSGGAVMLLGRVVDPDEAVVRTRTGGEVGLREIRLQVTARPGVVQVRGGTVVAVVKHEHGRTTVGFDRSEEHTSELQSLAYLVCRLLLEKKKIKTCMHVLFLPSL